MDVILNILGQLDVISLISGVVLGVLGLIPLKLRKGAKEVINKVDEALDKEVE